MERSVLSIGLVVALMGFSPQSCRLFDRPEGDGGVAPGADEGVLGEDLGWDMPLGDVWEAEEDGGEGLDGPVGDDLPPMERTVLFRLPVDNSPGPYLVAGRTIGVDHDPVDHGGLGTICLSYNGEENFPHCYDEHDGTDFVLEGGFETMDAGVAWVVAAADGVVTEVIDGNYDRCHMDILSLGVSCDGNPMVANEVVLEHADGRETLYGHLRSGSVQVEVGQSVRCGERLGLIGSSGYSTMPHLHFEVHDGEGSWVDPFGGVVSQPESFWVEQEGAEGLPGEACQGL